MSMLEQSPSESARLRLKSALWAFALTLGVFCILPASQADGFKRATEPAQNANAHLMLEEFYGAQTDLTPPAPAQSPAFSSSNVFSVQTQNSAAHNVAVSIPKADYGAFAPAAEGADFSFGSFSSSDFAGTGIGGGAGVSNLFYDLKNLDKIPRRIKSVGVKYPPQLLKRGVEGEVRLIVCIDENGSVSVESVQSSTDRLFEENAVAAAKLLRYEPPLKDGKPVKARFILPIPFKIAE